MFAAAARIAAALEVPLTVNAEAGYGLSPGGLVDALLSAGSLVATWRTPTTAPAG